MTLFYSSPLPRKNPVYMQPKLVWPALDTRSHKHREKEIGEVRGGVRERGVMKRGKSEEGREEGGRE